MTVKFEINGAPVDPYVNNLDKYRVLFDQGVLYDCTMN